MIPLLRAAVAAVLGLGLSALYWLPAAFERNWVDIKQATQDPGYNFENNWLFAHNANPVLALHDAINHQVSWIAVSMMAVAAVGFAIGYFRGTLFRGMLPIGKSSASRLWWIPLAAIPVVVLFFLFPISRPLWHLLPEMPFLQYPWRWLEAVEAPMAIFFVAAIWPSGRRARLAMFIALWRGVYRCNGIRVPILLSGLLSRRHCRFGSEHIRRRRRLRRHVRVRATGRRRLEHCNWPSRRLSRSRSLDRSRQA